MENNQGNVTLNFGFSGDLSITSNSGNTDLLSKYILPKAPTAIVEHVENTSKKEMKIVLIVLALVIVVIGGVFFDIYLATK